MSDTPSADSADGDITPAVAALSVPLEASTLSLQDRASWAVTTSAFLTLQSRVEGDLHREAGMTPFEFHVLLVLAGEDADAGELAMSVLAYRVDSSLSRLSHVVRRLETRGWITRRVSPSDARVTLARLTDEGRRKLRIGSEASARVITENWVRHLGDEDRRDLARASTRLLRGLREQHWLLDAPQQEEEQDEVSAPSAAPDETAAETAVKTASETPADTPENPGR